SSRAIETGKALFILGPDALGDLLPRSADCHAEGFPLPVGTTGDGRWAMGQADAFILPAGKKISPGVADLLGYLTSPGLARRFARELPGEFYSWAAEPGKGDAPVVDAPAEFLDLDTGAGAGAGE
ncbi:MAG: hypothetical protein Q8M76_03130, partial [Spirochaetaceae bacterium]|nr:hypothetical protein [Spirochaetaceae bacterium]